MKDAALAVFRNRIEDPLAFLFDAAINPSRSKIKGREKTEKIFSYIKDKRKEKKKETRVKMGMKVDMEIGMDEDGDEDEIVVPFVIDSLRSDGWEIIEESFLTHSSQGNVQGDVAVSQAHGRHSTDEMNTDVINKCRDKNRNDEKNENENEQDKDENEEDKDENEEDKDDDEESRRAGLAMLMGLDSSDSESESSTDNNDKKDDSYKKIIKKECDLDAIENITNGHKIPSKKDDKNDDEDVLESVGKKRIRSKNDSDCDSDFSSESIRNNENRIQNNKNRIQNNENRIKSSKNCFRNKRIVYSNDDDDNDNDNDEGDIEGIGEESKREGGVGGGGGTMSDGPDFSEQQEDGDGDAQCWKSDRDEGGSDGDEESDRDSDREESRKGQEEEEEDIEAGDASCNNYDENCNDEEEGYRNIPDSSTHQRTLDPDSFPQRDEQSSKDLHQAAVVLFVTTLGLRTVSTACTLRYFL